MNRLSENRHLRVCLVCSELPPAPAGGIGPCVLTTARSLVSAGHEVVVVGRYARDYGWSEPGVKVFPLLLPKQNGRFGMDRILYRWYIRRAIARVHRRTPIDIVEWPDFQGLFVTNISGTVDIVRNHGPLMSHRLIGLARLNRAQEFFEVRTLRRIPNWIGVSHWFMRQWLAISKAKPRTSTVIYNPVDCTLFRPGETRDANLILYAGSLLERKGVHALARAARCFLPQLPKARLLILGAEREPGVRDRLRDLVGPASAQQLEFGDPVPQSELASLMRRAAIFAMPSILESFGNVWAEAMASGTPVLGSCLTAGPEIVPAEIAGVLADPRQPADVARGVVRLMTEPGLRQAYGEAGRRIAMERYSIQAGIPRLVDFYRAVLRPASRPAAAGDPSITRPATQEATSGRITTYRVTDT